MDLHSFHPVFFATPHERYVIPQHVGNFGFAERTGIEVARAAAVSGRSGTADPRKVHNPRHGQMTKMEPRSGQDETGTNKGSAMKRKGKLSIAITTAGFVVGGAAVYAQDKYALNSPSGIAFADFKGYEDWAVVSR